MVISKLCLSSSSAAVVSALRRKTASEDSGSRVRRAAVAYRFLVRRHRILRLRRQVSGSAGRRNRRPFTRLKARASNANAARRFSLRRRCGAKWSIARLAAARLLFLAWKPRPGRRPPPRRHRRLFSIRFISSRSRRLRRRMTNGSKSSLALRLAPWPFSYWRSSSTR